MSKIKKKDVVIFQDTPYTIEKNCVGEIGIVLKIDKKCLDESDKDNAAYKIEFNLNYDYFRSDEFVVIGTMKRKKMICHKKYKSV